MLNFYDIATRYQLKIKQNLAMLVVSGAVAVMPVQGVAQTLTFTTGDWRPFVFEHAGNIQAQMPGFSIEIVNAAFRNMGYNLEYQTGPFKRQIAETMSGEFAGMVGLQVSDAPQLIYPKEGIGEVRHCFYVRQKSRWHYQQPDSIRQIKLGIVSGYTYGEIDPHIAQYRNSNIYAYSGDEDKILYRLVTLLEMDHVDAVIEDKAVMDFYLVQSGQKHKFKLAGCLENQQAMVGFTPLDARAQQWADEFDIQIDSMRKSGQLKRILSRYGVSDWK